MVTYLCRSGFLTPAIHFQFGVSQVLIFPRFYVQSSTWDSLIHLAEKQIVEEDVGNFRTPNTGCIIQTLHEKRVILISFASPMYFWGKATTKFRGKCRICVLLLIFFLSQSHWEWECWRFGGFLFTWQAGRLRVRNQDLLSLLGVWTSRTPLTSAFSSVKCVWSLLPCLSPWVPVLPRAWFLGRVKGCWVVQKQQWFLL